MATGGNNYSKYEASRRASGKLTLRDKAAEAVVVFLAEGYTVPEIPPLLATYLDLHIDEAGINTLLQKPDVQRRLAFKQQEHAENEVDRKQPISEVDYQNYALKKLWTLAKREDPKVSVRACIAIVDAVAAIRKANSGAIPPEKEDEGDPLADRLGEIMGDDGDGGEGNE